jgi:hypothetical protein
LVLCKARKVAGDDQAESMASRECVREIADELDGRTVPRGGHHCFWRKIFAQRPRPAYGCINDGIAAANARGVRFGRPATLDAHRDGIARLRAQGKSCRSIAAELEIPVGSVFQVFSELNRIPKAA